MITEGSSALKLPLNPWQEEIERYLSAEDGYWIQNDIWRTDAEAYRTGVVRESRREGILADFTECQDVYMKLELKYYILYAMALNVARCVGKEAATVAGDIEGIVLTGGISYSEYFTGEVKKNIKWIAPVTIYPGENEMESLALGGLRVLNGEEEAHTFVRTE